MSSLLDTARDVSIITVCHLIGMDEVVSSGRAIKYYCPLGYIFHSDPTQKAFRVYTDTNTAFCFGSCGFFDSISLYARTTGIVDKEGKPYWNKAAKELLSKVGITTVITTSWTELINPKESELNKEALKQAMKLFLAGEVENIKDLTLIQNAEAAYDQLETLLKYVNTSEQAALWMETGKQGIKNMLRRE